MADPIIVTRNGTTTPTTADLSNFQLGYDSAADILYIRDGAGIVTLGGGANLPSLMGLTFASESFVKMTAAGVFALDTSTYLTTGAASSTYVPYAGAAAAVNLGAHSLTVAEDIILNSDSKKLIFGTSQTLSLAAGIYSDSVDNINLSSTKTAVSIIMASSQTQFRIVADTTAGRGYFQAGIVGGSDSGRLYFSGYNAATAAAVFFKTSAARIAADTTLPTEKLEIGGNLWLAVDNYKIKLGTGKDAAIY